MIKGPSKQRGTFEQQGNEINETKKSKHRENSGKVLHPPTVDIIAVLKPVMPSVKNDTTRTKLEQSKKS